MHLGTEVVDPATIVGAEEIHAGERREPDLLDLHARKQCRLDVVNGGFARADGEAVGGRRAFGVEQRVHDDRACALCRPLDPEAAEVGKLLSLRIGSIEREPARRKAIRQALRHGAEIARAEKHADLVEIVRAVDRSVNAEARKAEVRLDVRRGLIAEREHRGRVDNGRRKPVLHLEDVDAVRVIEAAMKELQLERQALAPPERLLRHESDHAVTVVGQVLQLIRQLVVGRFVRFLRQIARECAHTGRFERHALILR